MQAPGRLRRIIKWVLIFFLLLVATVAFLLFYHNKFTDQVDSYVYELPFKPGTAHRIVQGYGGMFSHSHAAALDFAMPVGTAVYAARDGWVFRYKDTSDEGGWGDKYHRKANFIMIRHEDGSVGCYWHLQKNGVLVKEGYVAKGQQIGWSGATGQVWQPHLHFSVKPIMGYSMDAYIQTRFRTAEGIQILKAWRSYERPPDD